MDLSKLNLKPGSVLKVAGIGLVVIVVLTFIFQVLGPAIASLNPLRNRASQSSAGVASIGYAPAAYPMKSLADSYDAAMPELSVRNIAPVPPTGGGTSGNQAEEYEVKEYSGTIETRDLKNTCGTIKALKAQTYVIFEQANESDHACSYTFKVEKARVEQVLTEVKQLDPKDLAENTHTIKQVIDDYTSETEILQKKKATIEKTLDDAVKAYDEITSLATRTQDAASLARIIESKLQIIERLTQERMNVNEQLDRLARSKANQLDRLDYAYFSLNVYEKKIVDGEQLRDSWKEAVRDVVRNLNDVAQALTINLVALFFFVLQYVIYFFILLVVAKFVWKFAKAIWKS